MLHWLPFVLSVAALAIIARRYATSAERRQKATRLVRDRRAIGAGVAVFVGWSAVNLVVGGGSPLGAMVVPFLAGCAVAMVLAERTAPTP